MRGALSLDQRNALLSSMTDDVARHVLADNYNQTLALSVAEARGLRERALRRFAQAGGEPRQCG